VAQADAIAKAAGMKVVAIRNISVDSDNEFQPVRVSNGATANSVVSGYAGSPVDTASGEDQLSIRVNITAAATR
jgi:uncharacterized protein YggE